jgi:hypothetical protein
MKVSTTKIAEPVTAYQTSLMRIVPIVLTVVLGVICYGLFYNRSAWLSVIGYSVSPSERVLQGEVPYRDFLYNYTPGILWLNALLMHWFGVNLMVIHLGLFAFKLATIVILYFVARKLTGNWAALVPVALSLSWIGYKYIFGVFPTQYSMLFVLVGILAMLKYDESEKYAWLFLSGASVGAVFLFKYNVGILLLACGTAVIFIRYITTANGELVRRLLASLRLSAIYWAGFAVAVTPLIIYLVRNRALAAMVDHFLHHASAYSGERAVALPGLKWLTPVAVGLMIVIFGGWVVVRRVPKFFSVYIFLALALAAVAILIPGRAYVIKTSALATVAYLPLLLFIAIGFGVSVSYWFLVSNWQPAGKATLQSKKREWWEFNCQLIIVGLFALGTYLEIYPRADYYHVVRALTPTFLLITLLLGRAYPVLQELFEGQSPSLKQAAGWSIATIVGLLMVVGMANTWLPNFDSHFRFIDRESLTTQRGQGLLVPPKQAEFIESLTGLIEQNSGSDDPIFSFGQRGAGFYFLAARRNPTKFVWWRNVGIPKADRDMVIEMLKEKRAKLILLQDSLKDAHVREAVTTNYHHVGQVSGIAVYDRND